MELQNSHVVVTGGAHGIGRALVERFAQEGARAIVVVDRDGEAAEAVARSVGGIGVAADVTQEAPIQELVATAIERDGPIDLFCSNAGIAVRGGLETSDAEWERNFKLHVMAHVYAARAVLPSMLERGRGYLLQTASAAGLLSQIGSATYAVTKHGSVALAEWLAIEYGDQGIGVSVLCPQAVRTAMTADTEGGGVAAVDGMLEATEVADCVVRGLAEESFWILPHPEVRRYVERKATQIDRWLAGMRKLRKHYV